MLYQEQEPDRWCSHSPCGQECWQIISHWVWNLRLELVQQVHPAPVQTTEFAPAVLAAPEEEGSSPAESFGYRPAVQALPWKRGRFSGGSFALQSDGTLRCPAGQMLRPTEQRREHDGTLRVLYTARIRDCRGCQLRAQCQWHGTTTHKSRRVSLRFASPPCWLGSRPLEGLEPEAASPRLHAPAAAPTRGGARGADSPASLRAIAAALLTGAACALSPLVDRAART